MQPNQPAGNPPASTTTTMATSTAPQTTATQAMVVTGARNTRQRPATAAAGAALPPAPQALDPQQTQASQTVREQLQQTHPVANQHPLTALELQQRISALQLQQANAASGQGAQEALIDLFIRNINGLTLAAENKPTMADLYSVRLLRRAAAFNYPLAMRLSFSQAAIDACENPAQKFLMQQINQQPQPYIRLRLLVMAFICFYRAGSITQGRCAQLFNLSPGVISTWRTELFAHQSTSIDGITRSIRHADAELQGRGGHPLATDRARLGTPYQQEPDLNTPQQSNYTLTTGSGMIARNSLASVLSTLHQQVGLQWNNTPPHAASASIQGRSISSHTLMQQLSFDFTSANLSSMQLDVQELTQALLAAFNNSSSPSARLRLLLIATHYIRQHLYHSVTGDLCRILNIVPRTAAWWTQSFKQRIANPEGDISPRSFEAINAAISHISSLPIIAAIQINLVSPPSDTSAQTPVQEAAAAETTRVHTAAQQPQTPAQPRPTVQIPQQLLQLNLPAAQAAAPAAHRHGAAQHARRHHPYAPRQPQPHQQMQAHPHPQLQADRFALPPQQQTPLEPRPAAPQIATITYAPPLQPQQQQLEQARRAEQQARTQSVICFGKRTAPEEPKEPKK